MNFYSTLVVVALYYLHLMENIFTFPLSVGCKECQLNKYERESRFKFLFQFLMPESRLVRHAAPEYFVEESAFYVGPFVKLHFTVNGA